MQRNIIRQYYLFSGLFFIAGGQIISAVYMSYLLNNGLNFLQANLVNTFFYATLFICEIPTGAFADIYGRKKAFVLACALKGLGTLMYGWFGGFWGFVLAEIVAAIGATFANGALKAWLVDSLNHHGYTGELTVIFGRAKLIKEIGGGVGAILGAYLATIDGRIPWYVGGLTMIVVTFAANAVMDEVYFKKKKFSFLQGLHHMRDTAVVSIQYARNHGAARFVLLVTGIQIFSVMALNMFWQPFFKERGIAAVNFGYVFIGMTTALSLGAYLASRMHTDGRERSIILSGYVVIGMLVIAATQVQSLWLAIMLFVLHEVPRGTWEPVLSSYLHKSIPSETRATIDSFCSIAPHIGGAIGLPLSGWIAERYGINAAWVLSGTVFIAGSLVLLKTRRTT